MYVELFPFGTVKPNSRIVIYGFGNVGRQYWLQVRRTGYADVVAIVDKNKSKYCLIEPNLLDIDEFYALSSTAYDTVVIAISNQIIAHQIGREFQAHGIPSDKIIYTFNPSALLDGDLEEKLGMRPPTESIIDNPDKWVAFLNLIFFLKDKQWQYYDLIISAVRDLKIRNKELLELFKRKMNTKLSDKARLLLLRLMYEQECFDSECMKIWMHSLMDMEWDDDTPYFCVLNSDLPMLFYHPEFLYKEFFQERRQLFRKINRYYELTLPPVTEEKEKNNKVIFVFYYFDPDNAAYQITFQYIKEFFERGYEVKVLVLGAWDITEKRNLFMMPDMVASIDNFEEQWGRLNKDNIVVLTQYVNENTIGKRLQDAIDIICDYNPACIIDCTDECFPQAELLIKRFPIVYMPYRGHGTGAFFDYYITGDCEKALKCGTVSSTQLAKCVLGNMPTVKDSVKYSREDLGLGENDFIMITVGYRLQQEMKASFLEAICNFLIDEKKAKWILVEGDVPVSFTLDKFNKLVDEGKIIHRGKEEYLESLYIICDVFVNPNRQGGASAIRRAMVAGLPIAMTDYPSDNLVRMRGHVVHGGYDELIRYIRRLSCDANFCDSEGRAMQDLMVDYSAKKDADQVIAVCEKAVQRRKQNDGRLICTR